MTPALKAHRLARRVQHCFLPQIIATASAGGCLCQLLGGGAVCVDSAMTCNLALTGSCANFNCAYVDKAFVIGKKAPFSRRRM
jgi:hypothetical protein